MRIVVNDAGDPPRSATAMAQINIIRNFFKPEFTNREYKKTILETMDIGALVTEVKATDKDSKVA